MNTIFAPATAIGKSGIAVIRISGPQATNSVKALGAFLPPARQASLQKLYEPATREMLDEALILWFPGPASFTGEDVVELHIHGSIAVMRSLIEVLGTIDGLRLAEPGEFSKRAFLNGRMDLTEAEGIADLIDAETKMQQKQAVRQMTGVLLELYEAWRRDIISSLALVESYIDFPDEDLPDYIVADLDNAVQSLIASLRHHLNDNHRGERLRQGLHVTIIGAPNVGKSSLLNLLAKKDAAIVSNIAGTTRDVIEVRLDLAGFPITVADTAGLRESVDEIENEGIKRAISNAQGADLKLAVFDAGNLPELDLATLELLDDQTIIVINKIDQQAVLPAEIRGHKPILLSIKEQVGIDQLLKALESFAEREIAPTSDPVITRVRHRQYLQISLHALELFSLDDPIELSAENLRQAAQALAQITGKIDVDEILGEIFSRFCIGK